jgi:hypothetical protein
MRAVALAVVKVIALHTVRTRVGCSLGANRNATRINRMARAARCAGVTCTRHLEGVPKSNAFVGPTGYTAANAVCGPFMPVPWRSVEPTRCGSPSPK